MYPQRSNFSNGIFDDAWVVTRLGSGPSSNEDICHTSGSFVLRAVRMYVRFKMRLEKTRNPFVVDGVRYTLDSTIERAIGDEYWTELLLKLYNECVNRARNTNRRLYFDTSRVTKDLLIGLFEGGIISAKTDPYFALVFGQWNGSFGNSSGELAVSIPDDVILPGLRQPLIPVTRALFPTPEAGCTGRGNLDSSYTSPAERYQQSEEMSALAIVFGIGLLAIVATRG